MTQIKKNEKKLLTLLITVAIINLAFDALTK